MLLTYHLPCCLSYATSHCNLSTVSSKNVLFSKQNKGNIFYTLTKLCLCLTQTLRMQSFHWRNLHTLLFIINKSLHIVIFKRYNLEKTVFEGLFFLYEPQINLKHKIKDFSSRLQHKYQFNDHHMKAGPNGVTVAWQRYPARRNQLPGGREALKAAWAQQPPKPWCGKAAVLCLTSSSRMRQSGKTSVCLFLLRSVVHDDSCFRVTAISSIQSLTWTRCRKELRVCVCVCGPAGFTFSSDPQCQIIVVIPLSCWWFEYKCLAFVFRFESPRTSGNFW